jgi:geranylgeranyl pyrophosphate synthase
MSTNPTITRIRRTLKQKGGLAMKNARKTIMQTFKDDSYSSQALRYFSKVTLQGALPVFPALVELSCEALCGNCEKSVSFGEAIVLISAAADLHDDVIDHSFTKGTKQTVLGRFDSATTILAGDILLVQGFKQLSEAAESIPQKQSREITKLMSQAVFEICTAESLETQLHKRNDLRPEEYHEVIRLKAVVPELSMKIGAILGNGNAEEVESLGHYGRIYGINSVIFEEFADMLEIGELQNRLKNEVLPLPVLYALQNQQIKTELFPLLGTDLNEITHKQIIDTVLASKEVEALGKYLFSNAENEVKQLSKDLSSNIREELANFLLVPLKYIEI